MNTHELDMDFEDRTVVSLDGGDGMTLDSGWSFGIPKGTTPKVGSVIRFWPGEHHNFKRGVMVDGVLAYYRTEVEDKEQRAIDLYGKDAADWVARWDAGKSVWSISMGGLGPGYEQCIQVLAVEVVRSWVETSPNWWSGTKEENDAKWKEVRADADKVVDVLDKAFGFSGAQVGQAINLAGHIYRKGPRAIMEDEAVKDRHIQVGRDFPTWPAQGIVASSPEPSSARTTADSPVALSDAPKEQ